MQTLGFIGLGNLGNPMARNLQKYSGLDLVVHDLNQERTKTFLDHGALFAPSPAEVAEKSDVIFTSLPGPDEVEEVATSSQGILDGIKKGSIYVDLSTSQPDLIRRLEPMFAKKGASVLDAPVLSTKTDAPNRNAVVLVGGQRKIFEKVLPIFNSFANHVIHTGKLGTGTICKLVNNMMILGVRQTIAEGLTLGLKAGLSLEVLMDSGNSGVLGTMSRKLEQTVFTGRFEFANFALILAQKDIKLALDMAKEHSVPTPTVSIVQELINESVSRGWAEYDSSAIFLLQEEAAGIEVRNTQ